MTDKKNIEDFSFEDWPRTVMYVATDNNSKNAQRFLAARPHKLIVSNGQIYSLNSGIWLQIEPDTFAAEVQATNKPQLTLSAKGILAVVAAIKLECYTNAKPFEWIERPARAPDARDMIPFHNGLLDFKTGKLRKYDGRYFATGRPNFDYDPKAKCPRWKQALEEWFEQSSDSRVEMVPTLQEFFGYAMTPDTSLHAILALLGSGRGGKSTIVNTLAGLCGPMHFKTTGLGDLAGPHGLQGLEDARIINIPDAADTNLSNRAQALGRIKAISGGDPVRINPKNIKPFDTTIPARFVMVANRHPKFLDDSGALAMRELPIMFTRSFVDDKARDPALGDKLRAELPGIANWALEGLARLRKQGRFTEGDALRRARADIEGQQSHMAAFARDLLKFTPGAWVKKSDMYDAYEQWHRDARVGPREVRDKESFKGDLIAACARHGVKLAQRYVGGKNKGEQWRGVEVKDGRLRALRQSNPRF